MMARIMPMRTNTTIAPCIQIHVGDIAQRLPVSAIVDPGAPALVPVRIYRVDMFGCRKPVGAGALVLCALLLLAPTALAPAGVARAPAHLARAAARRLEHHRLWLQPDRRPAATSHARTLYTRRWCGWTPLVGDGATRGRPARRAPSPSRIALKPRRSDRRRGDHAVESTPCWASSAPARGARRCDARRAGRPTRGLHENGRTSRNSWPSWLSATRARWPPSRSGTSPIRSTSITSRAPTKPSAMRRSCGPRTRRSSRRTGRARAGGSLVGSNGVFLRALYAAGIKGYYDGLAVHFYTLTLASCGRSTKSSWPTATRRRCGSTSSAGSSCWPHFKIQQEQACVTKQLQGSNLASMFRSLAHARYVAARHRVQAAGQRLRRLRGAQRERTRASRPSRRSPRPWPRPGGQRGQRDAEPAPDGPAAPTAPGRRAITCAWRSRESGCCATSRCSARSLQPLLVRAALGLGTSGLWIRVFQYWQGARRRAAQSLSAAPSASRRRSSAAQRRPAPRASRPIGVLGAEALQPLPVGGACRSADPRPPLGERRAQLADVDEPRRPARAGRAAARRARPS